MDKSRIKYLLEQYANNLASKEEVEEMFELMHLSETNEALKAFITETAKEEDSEISLPEQHWDKMWSVIQSATTQQPKKLQVLPMTWMRVAAAVILFVL